MMVAAAKKFRVDSYDDEAEGVMGKDAQGRVAMTRVTLRPMIRFSGDLMPTAADTEALHHAAHEHCFIANSVKSDVRVEPR